jgi:hypothetical protein
MSNTKLARLIGTACTVLALAACGPAPVPGPAPDESGGQNPGHPTPYELELCFRRVPTPRC